MGTVSICCAICGSWSKVPVIVLSARVSEHDKIEALDAGADDYLTKPFGVGELLARVRAATRRRQDLGINPSVPFEFGDVSVDLGTRTVRKGGVPVHLTPIEYRLLCLLIANEGRVLTHRQILSDVWGPSHAADGHYLRVYMGHLRQKMEDDPARPQHIITETAVGYRLVQKSKSWFDAAAGVSGRVARGRFLYGFFNTPSNNRHIRILRANP
jgi:two-component system KDP operon response regulator KdpE